MPREKLTVGVTGGRAYRDYHAVQKALAKVSARFDITVVHGDADGADAWARIWCERTGTPQMKYPAEWKKYGDAAGTLRNQQMVAEAGIQLLLSFPGGSGTRDMTDRCLLANIPVKLIREVKNDRPQRVEVAAAEGAAGEVQPD